MGSCANLYAPLWTPKPDDVSQLRMEKLRLTINEKYGANLGKLH